MAGVIDDEALADFYRARLMVPQVRPEQLTNIAPSLIAKIPVEMAAEFRCIPVACDRDRNLTLAMADPSTTHTVDEISFYTGHYVVRAVATQSQIAWCLARYYGVVTPLAERMSAGRGESGPTRLPPFPMPGAVAPEKSGPMAVSGTGGRHSARIPAPLRDDSAPVRGPRRDNSRREGLPLPAPSDGDSQPHGGETSSPVPVIIENDRPSPGPAYIPPETREPGISFLHEETAPTGPMRLLQRRPTPEPDLEDRAGEFDVPSGPVPQIDDSLPAVMVSPMLDHDHGTAAGPQPGRRDADAVGAVPEPISTEASVETKSTRTRATPATGPAQAPLDDDQAEARRQAADDTPTEEIVLLERHKSRRHRRTRIGLGINPSVLKQLTTTNPRAPEDALDAPEDALDAPEDGVPAAPDPAEPNHARGPDSAGIERADAPASAASGEGAVPAERLGEGDSIQAAAQAAAEAYSRRGDSESSGHHAVPRPVDDEHRAASGAATSPPDSAPSAPYPNRGAVAEARPDADSAPDSGHAKRERSLLDDAEDDERWGPPGSTIPPEYLRPLHQDLPDSGPSPVPLLAEHVPSSFDDADVEQMMNEGFDLPSAEPQTIGRGPGDDDRGAGESASAARALSPEMRGPYAPTPREVPTEARRPPSAPGSEVSFYGPEPRTPDVAQELEDSSLRLVEILRELDQASDRTEVVDTLIRHLSESYQRVAFLTIRAGDLTTWKQRLGKGPIERRDGIKLSLEESSTFQDVVGTRLPFRGPLTDPVSRAFVAAALGHLAGEILALPVSVRGRVVGVLYGDSRTRRVFEQHLAVVTRAAGVALERILRARKAP